MVVFSKRQEGFAVRKKLIGTRVLACAALATLLTGALTACLAAPPDTSKIVKVSSVTSAGYVWDYYRNTAYPCSVSGYQTFVIGRKVGSSDTASKPLWAYMHGGGVGSFSSAGVPLPNANNMDEESRTTLLSYLTGPGLVSKVRASGYRILGVSMCSHDAYGGMNTADPHNPNRTPGGQLRPTTGLIATKSAIAFAKAEYPSDDVFLHGTSAGSVGTYHVAWSLQLQGDPPTGVVADASILNQEQFQASYAQSVCTTAAEYGVKAGLLARIHPEVADPDNQPDRLVSRGELTVPLMHVWNKGDTNTCSDTTMSCPVNGGTVTLGSTTCIHRPMTLAIAALGSASRSRNLPLCVEGTSSIACDKHVVTMIDGTNTLVGSPADYNQAIWDWVQLRRADD
jgi:hypothetical protein